MKAYKKRAKTSVKRKSGWNFKAAERTKTTKKLISLLKLFLGLETKAKKSGKTSSSKKKQLVKRTSTRMSSRAKTRKTASRRSSSKKMAA
jgi:hypothetical protein